MRTTQIITATAATAVAISLNATLHGYVNFNGVVVEPVSARRFLLGMEEERKNKMELDQQLDQQLATMQLGKGPGSLNNNSSGSNTSSDSDEKDKQTQKQKDKVAVSREKVQSPQAQQQDEDNRHIDHMISHIRTTSRKRLRDKEKVEDQTEHFRWVKKKNGCYREISITHETYQEKPGGKQDDFKRKLRRERILQREANDESCKEANKEANTPAFEDIENWVESASGEKQSRKKVISEGLYEMKKSRKKEYQRDFQDREKRKGVKSESPPKKKSIFSDEDNLKHQGKKHQMLKHPSQLTFNPPAEENGNPHHGIHSDESMQIEEKNQDLVRMMEGMSLGDENRRQGLGGDENRGQRSGGDGQGKIKELKKKRAKEFREEQGLGKFLDRRELDKKDSGPGALTVAFEQLALIPRVSNSEFSSDGSSDSDSSGDGQDQDVESHSRSGMNGEMQSHKNLLKHRKLSHKDNLLSSPSIDRDGQRVKADLFALGESQQMAGARIGDALDLDALVDQAALDLDGNALGVDALDEDDSVTHEDDSGQSLPSNIEHPLANISGIEVVDEKLADMSDSEILDEEVLDEKHVLNQQKLQNKSMTGKKSYSLSKQKEEKSYVLEEKKGEEVPQKPVPHKPTQSEFLPPVFDWKLPEILPDTDSRHDVEIDSEIGLADCEVNSPDDCEVKMLAIDLEEQFLKYIRQEVNPELALEKERLKKKLEVGQRLQQPNNADINMENSENEEDMHEKGVIKQHNNNNNNNNSMSGESAKLLKKQHKECDNGLNFDSDDEYIEKI